MALSPLEYIGEKVKEQNVFFDSYAVNAVQLKDGQVVSFDDQKEKKYEGISDNLGTAFYIRSNPQINYVAETRRTSSLRKRDYSVKTCRLVAYSFRQNEDLTSEELTKKLLTDLSRIVFKPGSYAEITIKRSNANYIDNFFDETKKNLDYGQYFICVSIDFELRYHQDLCDDCPDDDEPVTEIYVLGTEDGNAIVTEDGKYIRLF